MARMNRFPMLRSGLWTRHPSLLWHYPTTYLRHLRTIRSTAGIRADYEKLAADGLFTERWFDVNIIPWCAALSRVFDRTDPLNILEVGSWEGRSTLFLAMYFPHAQLTAVDTWEGSQESVTAATDVAGLETRFDHNLSAFTGRITKHRGMSSTVLPKLLAENRRFDLIYVDGSHYAPDVLTDALTAWQLLKPGGVIIFDDFLWHSYPRKHANPGWGISTFLKFHAGDYRILGAYYQMILQKTAAHTDHIAMA